MKISGRRQASLWLAVAVICASGALSWSLLCVASLVHGDVPRTLAAGTGCALAVYGTVHALGKRRSWAPRR
jgi:hypothetical protein